jgi:hypothetical protein
MVVVGPSILFGMSVMTWLPESGFYIFILYSSVQSYVLSTRGIVSSMGKKGPAEPCKINKTWFHISYAYSYLL